MQTIEEIWERIEIWLKRYAPNILSGFQPGATDEELEHAEAVLGVELPEDLKAWYRLHNGSNGRFFLDGWYLLNVKNLVASWQMGQDLSGGEDLEVPPAGPIRRVSWHPRWVPFMSDGSGDYLCLDLAPGPGGQVGQVICQPKGDRAWGPFAPNLSWYLAFFVTELEEGEYGLDQFGAPKSEDRLSTIPVRMGTEQHGSLVGTHELIERVARRVGTSQEESASTVEALLRVLLDTLKAGEEVRLVGFGAFCVLRPVVLTTIDPHTGATRAAPTSPSVRFHAGTELQEAISSA